MLKEKKLRCNPEVARRKGRKGTMSCEEKRMVECNVKEIEKLGTFLFFT
jgi:hypothetical protein